jgi:hypothetical protein
MPSFETRAERALFRMRAEYVASIPALAGATLGL